MKVSAILLDEYEMFVTTLEYEEDYIYKAILVNANVYLIKNSHEIGERATVYYQRYNAPVFKHEVS